MNFFTFLHSKFWLLTAFFHKMSGLLTNLKKVFYYYSMEPRVWAVTESQRPEPTKTRIKKRMRWFFLCKILRLHKEKACGAWWDVMNGGNNRYIYIYCILANIFDVYVHNQLIIISLHIIVYNTYCTVQCTVYIITVQYTW